jgi:hypothetical protein
MTPDLMQPLLRRPQRTTPFNFILRRRKAPKQMQFIHMLRLLIGGGRPNVWEIASSVSLLKLMIEEKFVHLRIII